MSARFCLLMAKADQNRSTPWENSKDYCLLSEKPMKSNVAVNRWKRGAKLKSCTSAHDLRCLDIEKEKNDVSSPRGVIEACLNDLESNTDSNSSENTETRNVRHSHWRKFKFLKSWKKKSVKCVPSLPPLTLPKISSRKCKSTRENPMLRDFYYFKSSLKEFTLSELEDATCNFSQENLIGKGGFAEVYKGTLPDGKLIAVKQLTKGTIDEKATVLLSEIGIMAHINHRNVAKLIGSCIDGGMHLIFQLSQLGCLGSILHGSEDSKLDWSKRYKIALGIADGLRYLHETCEKRIIHRDIKADNILLTEDFEPQICDFGLAKWLPKQWTHHNVSKFEGTFGYFAPEYFMHGIVDEKTDIYAFGVLLLELITGRRALDDVQQSVVIWAKPLLADNLIKELVDPSLGDDYDSKEMDRVIWSASSCIEHSPVLRPQMSQVVVMLRGDEYAAELAKKFPKRHLQRTYSEELFDAQEYNSTKYLDRLREIALA